MSILRSTYRQRLIDRLEKKEAQLAALEESFLEAAGIPIEEYRFNSGEGGNQWAKRRNLREMWDIYHSLENEIDLLYRRLERNGGPTRIRVVRR